MQRLQLEKIVNYILMNRKKQKLLVHMYDWLFCLSECSVVLCCLCESFL